MPIGRTVSVVLLLLECALLLPTSRTHEAPREGRRRERQLSSLEAGCANCCARTAPSTQHASAAKHPRHLGLGCLHVRSMTTSGHFVPSVLAHVLFQSAPKSLPPHAVVAPGLYYGDVLFSAISWYLPRERLLSASGTTRGGITPNRRTLRRPSSASYLAHRKTAGLGAVTSGPGPRSVDEPTQLPSTVVRGFLSEGLRIRIRRQRITGRFSRAEPAAPTAGSSHRIQWTGDPFLT